MRKYISILILAIVCLSSQVFATTSPVVTSANVSTDGKSITVVFSKPLATYSPTQARKTFTIKVNGTSIYISTMTQLNTSTIVFPNLSIAYGNVVTISYAGTLLFDAVDNTLLVATFTDLNVSNNGMSTPSVNGYLENFNDNTLTGWNGGTQYALTESGQVLTVAANTDATYKSMAFTIPVTVDMTTSPTVTFTLTTVNPIDIRVDVQDAKGNTTNNTELKKTGLTSGTYTFTIADFTELYDSLGTKLSSAVSVDKMIIKRVFIFTNPGATYSGSFTIDDLTIGVPPTAVTEVTVTPTTLSMNVGENKTISAVVAPINATNQILTWTSSDKTIATVGSNGVVTAVAQGTVTITATSSDNATLFAITSLTVASTVVNKTTLTSEIATAISLTNAAVVGLQDGQYSQGAVDSLVTAISSAQTVNTNSTSQTEINAMVITLQSAMDLFSSKIISSIVTKVALQAKINAATTLKTYAVVGTHVGQYLQTDVDTLTIAILDAQAVYINASATQLVVNAMVISLQKAMDYFSLKEIPVPFKGSLLNAINSANTLLNSAIAGTALNQYPQSAIDALLTVRNVANTIYNSSSANQTEIDSEMNALLNAIPVFNSSKVASVADYRLLLTAITDATTLAANTTVGTAYGNVSQTAMTALNSAISSAQAVKANASATQSQIDAATSSIQTAVQTFQTAIIKTEIREMDAISISASPVLFNESIIIKSNGTQMKSVTLFAITGSVVLEEKALSESINFSTTDLPKGLYLILVKLSNGDSKVLKVVK